MGCCCSFLCLRQVDTIFATIWRALGEPAPALRVLFWWRGGIGYLFDSFAASSTARKKWAFVAAFPWDPSRR
jgi:hypothetical protein